MQGRRYGRPNILVLFSDGALPQGDCRLATVWRDFGFKFFDLNIQFDSFFVRHWVHL